MSILIPDQKNLDKVIVKMSQQGAGSLHVLSDFDRTFTKAFVDGQKSPTVFAQIRNGGFLTPDYAPRAHALYDHYRPIEINQQLPRPEKEAQMQEWWQKHFDLFIECGLNKTVMKEIAERKTLQFRAGALELIDLLHQYDIPLVFMSASPGDLIAMYLEQEGRLYDNVQVVANFLEFNEQGHVIGVKKPIIHSLNKYEIILKDYPAFNLVKERKNVVLIGDGVDDIGMITGFDYNNLFKIGFLNENIKEQQSEFEKNFDLIIMEDGDMFKIDEILKKIIDGTN